MELLELEQDQYLIIEKEKYKVLNKVKFIEKSSYWIEYKLQKIDNAERHYLNVEISGKAILYKIIEAKDIQIKMNMTIQEEAFELFEKGIGKVENYYGMTDVGLKEEVNYYEYKSKVDNQKILSIEKWKDEIEVSIGKIISLRNIKILKEFER